MSYQLHLEHSPMMKIQSLTLATLLTIVPDTTKQKIEYSHKYFSQYSQHQCNNSIFIQPRDIKKIAYIISSLTIDKDSGLYKNTFQSILKTAKRLPVLKKDSILDCCSYRPMVLLSNVEKNPEKLMHKKVYIFFD